ncbi:hypothetical protein [Sphaerospermopsis torques-reginae]|jgi:hypothetical protein|uniref:Uncharacterized protein n=1 Tax=Sphaerospermopsis torques-reginae ITEP-024 TaxID=984208 RepID=A0ABX8X2D1_9CYAN|nr:hypothetical protein [Sphaerospermopsis torques-reginae]QYX32834.1 hypothetical protein K2F26_05645 [Sphaerospermopsis torques-reginae ITEP-024]
MTKKTEKFLVNFSLLWLLAQKFISGRVQKPTDKLITETPRLGESRKSLETWEKK